MGPVNGCDFSSLRWRHPDDRQFGYSGSSTCGRSKKGGGDRCMGRSRGGLSTKIHALVDAEGLPVRLALTPGQASDVHGADMLLNELAAGWAKKGQAPEADGLACHRSQIGPPLEDHHQCSRLEAVCLLPWKTPLFSILNHDQPNRPLMSQIFSDWYNGMDRLLPPPAG